MPSTLYLLAIVYVRCVAQPHELRRYINSGVLENYYTQTTTLKVLFSPINMDCLTCINFLGFTIGHNSSCYSTGHQQNCHNHNSSCYSKGHQQNCHNRNSSCYSTNKVVKITIFFLLQLRISTKLSKSQFFFWQVRTSTKLSQAQFFL